MEECASCCGMVQPAPGSLAGEAWIDDMPEDISRLSPDALRQLQWNLERAIAREVIAAPKGSSRRAEAVRHGYDTITRVLTARSGTPDEPLVMGMHEKDARLVLELLTRQEARGVRPGFFEIGYGCGALLRQVSRHGYPVAGIEVSGTMRDQALQQLGAEHERELLLGDFVGDQSTNLNRRFSLVYWNDVFEHIAPDEVLDYLKKINDLLVPGGQLVTITPNWHMRPSDITREVCPLRTEAAGLHLKEYTLREVTDLLRRAGFRQVTVPLFVLPGRIVTLGSGFASPKRLFESCLEFLPFWLAELICRGLGLSCTIATAP